MDIHIIANKTLQRSWITPWRRQVFHWFLSLVPAIHHCGCWSVTWLFNQPVQGPWPVFFKRNPIKWDAGREEFRFRFPELSVGNSNIFKSYFRFVCHSWNIHNKPDKPIPLDPMDRNAPSLRPVLTLLGLKVIACSWPRWPLFKKFCHVGITMPCLPPITGNGEHTIAILWWWLGDGFHEFVLPTLPSHWTPKFDPMAAIFHISPGKSVQFQPNLAFCNPNPIWTWFQTGEPPKNHPNFHHFFLLYTIPFGSPHHGTLPISHGFLQWNTPSLNFGALCLASELQRMGCKCLADDILKWSPGNTMRIRKKWYLVVPWCWDTIRSDYGKCWIRDMNNEMKW